MADYDPDVFGGPPKSVSGYDPDVFKGGSKAKVDVRKLIDNDEISRGARDFASQGSDAFGGVSQGALNLLAGAVRGAGSIGATLARPFESKEENDQRRAGIDENLKSVGAQPDSLIYRGGKVTAEVAGTLGVGGVAGQVASKVLPAVGASAPLVSAVSRGLETSGFDVDGVTGAAGLATRAATGAVSGGLSSAAVDPDDAVNGAVIGGAVPVAIKGIGQVGRAINDSVLPKSSPEVAQLAKRAEELGIDIPADRLVDSRPLNAIASSLNYVPLSGRALTEDVMNSQLNRAVSRTVGQDSSNITQALRKAQVDLGQKFDQTLSQNSVNFDEQFLNDLATIHNQADAELTSDALRPIQNKINDLIAKGEDGVIPGQAAYNIKRDLDRLSRSNTPTAHWASELKGALMDALDRSLGPDAAAEFATTRQQYANMLQLEKLAPNGAEGEISAARLANMRDIRTPQMQELADIAATFIKPREGAHGAAQRVFGAGGVLGAAGAIGALVGGPVGAAIGAAGTMATGRAANGVLNSQGVRNAILGSASAGADAMGAIGTTAVKALPVIGAGVAVPGLASQADPVKNITDSGSVDQAVNAAMNSVGPSSNVNGELDKLRAVTPQAMPAARPMSAPVSFERPTVDASPTQDAPGATAPARNAEPVSQWFGRRGSGYLSAGDAEMALESRRRKEPQLTWQVEGMQNGRFRIAGYGQPEDQAPSAPIKLSDTGTALIPGNSASIRSLLAEYGITATLPTRGGVLVAKNQAGAALDLMGRLGWNVAQPQGMQ